MTPPRIVAHPGYLADFDSTTAMLRALASYLRGEDFPLLGAMPRWTAPFMKMVGTLVNKLPRSLQEEVYIWSGWYEAVAQRKLHLVSGDEVAEWMVNLYPKRTYPAAVVGSANGAATHLWAALGIPWLPQTFLVPVARSGVHPDEPLQEVNWGMQPAKTVLERNPDLQLHHMHDPIQDRLMLQRMSYFRFKRLRLGAAYERFLRESLEPGATIFVMECGLSWPTTQYGDRHLFQFGALGGATIDELVHGGDRVADYLRRYRSHRRRWEPPAPDRYRPEAEWGFEPALREDLERFAHRHGYRLRRILFEHPEQMSPLVADCYAWWNQQREIREKRLLVESFIVLEPFWTIRTGSIPFWMVFNKQPSAEALEAYLKERAPYNELSMMLFSHGVDSIGLVPIDRWRQLMQRWSTTSTFVGVDPEAYPRDFAVFVRYYFDIRQKIHARYPVPPSLTLEALDTFLREHGLRYRVQWIEV